MIIFEDKSYITRSDKPNEDWTGEALYVVDDRSELRRKISILSPWYDFVLDADGNLIDVTEVEHDEPEPLPINPQPTLEERVADLEAENETISEVLDALLMGDIEV